MTLEQKKQNELFFIRIIATLNENGVYCFPDAGSIFTKKNGMLVGTVKDLSTVKDLVTPEFFQRYFTIPNYN
jgi:hypothetical protein